MKTTLGISVAAGLPLLFLNGCGMDSETKQDGARTFAQDVAFLEKHTEAFVLERDGGSVVVVPDYQGRVMTSSAGGEDDLSFGWLNYEVITEGVQTPEEIAGTLKEHIYVFGGEERFWLGPEGGQYAIYFAPGVPFDFTNWHTPALIDTEPFVVKSKTDSAAVFGREFELKNFSGNPFHGDIERKVEVLSRADIETNLGITLPESVLSVAYQTENTLKNLGPNDWTRETGLLSIWLLGMYKPGPETTVMIPFASGSESELGPKVNDEYFGKVPAERLIVEDDILYFSADGTYRSKIGLTAKRAKGIAGSYDAVNQVLTVVTYNERAADLPYVNSMWELQEDPYSGDVINSYNDGSPEPGAPPLGPFYEIETSSPGAELKVGESLTHTSRTAHFQGPEAELDELCVRLFGVSLEKVKGAM